MLLTKAICIGNTEVLNKRDRLSVLSVGNFTEARTVSANISVRTKSFLEALKKLLITSRTQSNKLKVYKKKLNKS